ncbi:MAG: sugar ABC transporter substrate-binding protein [Planctomycetaceae bacterium]|nr:sugar ABC transporter substrate-binding protein [Planctomycetaceae bacterium]
MYSPRQYLYAVCLGLVVCGCGAADTTTDSGQIVQKSPEPGSSTELPDKTIRVALVMKSLANEFFSTMADGATAYAQEHTEQFQLIVNGIPDETDLSAQVSLVEQMIAQEVDAIVVAPADSQALVPVLKRAHDAGIVIVNIDNKLDAAALEKAGMVVPFVGPDNRAGAKKVGDFLASTLKKGDPVAVLEGVATSWNGQQRKLGFEDAMNSAGMIIVDSQSASWEMSIANQTTAGILTAHPEVKAILCCNDSMALGALSAAKSADRTDLAIVGFDNISAVQQAIIEGRILATADQHGDQLAVFGVKLALEILNDAQAVPHDQETPVDLVTAETLSE